jgi:hypothetical protein
MRKLIIAFVLSGCMPTPMVSDYNGDSVKIRSLGLAGSAPGAEDQAKASEVCAPKRAIHAGTVPVVGMDSFADFVFLCR